MSRAFCGRYRNVAERMLAAQLVHSRDDMSRVLSLDFLNRQLVWQELSDLLLFILPLLHSLRNRCGGLARNMLRTGLSSVACPALQLSFFGSARRTRGLAHWRWRLRGVPYVQSLDCAAVHGGSLRAQRLLLLHDCCMPSKRKASVPSVFCSSRGCASWIAAAR